MAGAPRGRARPRPYSRSVSPAASLAAGGLILAALLFNMALARINAAVMPLNQGHVIAAEAVIVVAAIAVGLFALTRASIPIFLFMLAIIAWGMLLSIVNGTFDPKVIRDAMIIPAFVLLGAAYHPRSITALMGTVTAIVLAVMAFEALATPLYESLLHIKSYYINTRGFEESGFWNTDSDLFVSATRPGGDRFVFDFLGPHRLSSIFLEPVSLGNFAVAIMVFLVGFWAAMTPLQRGFFAAAFAATAIGSDGRLATVLGLLIAATAPFARHLPRYAPLAYLPVAAVLAAAAVSVFGFQVEDNFPGRLAVMVELFRDMSLSIGIGLDRDWPGFATRALDSGLVYLIATQSIFGALALWVFAAVALPQRDGRGIALTHAVCLTMALTLLVSYSFFSIKFGALIWFIYGYAFRAAETEPASIDGARPGPEGASAPRRRGGPGARDRAPVPSPPVPSP
ncbi:MAG: hypothetical protein RID91_13425 [Azospirillaceae bacterium]